VEAEVSFIGRHQTREKCLDIVSLRHRLKIPPEERTATPESRGGFDLTSKWRKKVPGTVKKIIKPLGAGQLKTPK